MKAPRGLRIEAIHNKGDHSLVEVTVFGPYQSRSAEIVLDSNTASLVEEVRSLRPLKKASTDEYSLWIQDVGNVQRSAGDTVVRADPKIYLLIRRGRSRLLETVPCTAADWEAIRPIARETLDAVTVQDLERYESTRKYAWQAPRSEA